MSATPLEVYRKYKDWDTDIWWLDDKIVDGDGGAVAYVGYESPLDADEIVRRLNAFDALLAVARAAHKNETHSSDSRNSEELNMLLAELDSLHPGWREWKP